MCLKAISLFIMHKLFFPAKLAGGPVGNDRVSLPWLFSLLGAKWTFKLSLKTTVRVESSNLSQWVVVEAIK